MISYVKPIYQDETLIGVVGIDIDFKYFEEVINGIKVYENGYSFLLDDKYNFLIHPELTNEDNLSTLNDGEYKYIIDKIAKKSEETVKIKFEGVDKLLTFSYLSNGWTLVVLAPNFEIY
ncbi:cache domain-containing protein [Orenia metallireducens]|nr:cache domain-containing protein [Orenia metallireducens]